MKSDEIAVDDAPEVADENGPPEPVVSDHPQPTPRNRLFAELLKAIEHWVQTR